MSNAFKLKFVTILTLFLIAPFVVRAFSVGEVEKFYVEKNYDLNQREEISAILVRISEKLLFYVEEDWWKELGTTEKGKVAQNLIDLSSEFNRKIYPQLTSTFGNIPKHSLDNSGKITVLFHSMKKDVGGYFRTGDYYSKLEFPFSNQRNMLYLNLNRIGDSLLPSYFSHEFLHLITFNQKQVLRNVTEETWLEELRAEYAPSFLGYDKEYKGSYLEKRVKIFLDNPKESLVRWRDRLSNYGVINLFSQYLVDHYGIKILADSLQSNKTGIESLNYALAKNNYDKKFSDIFTDWAIALLVNDCALGEKYCYLNPNLKDLKIAPQFYYLPSEGEPYLRITENIYNWSASWNKIVGGKEDLILKVEGDEEVILPYLLCDYQEKCQVGFLEIEKGGGEKIFFNFGEKYRSLIIVPLAQPKSNPDDPRTFRLVWSIESRETKEGEEEKLKVQLLAQIAELQERIRQLQAQLNALLAEKNQPIITCQIENNLYFGMRNNPEVSCLQEFLKNQGPDIYPEGLVTGNFLNLTQQAVIRFQEKYAQEILKPLGLEKGTGFVGPATRNKINQLLKY